MKKLVILKVALAIEIDASEHANFQDLARAKVDAFREAARPFKDWGINFSEPALIRIEEIKP